MGSNFTGGGPHEWGYRDLADGTFIADGTPFEMAERLETLRQALPALLADRDRLSARVVELEWALRKLCEAHEWLYSDYRDQREEEYKNARRLVPEEVLREEGT